MSPRAATNIEAVARTSQGARQRLQIRDLSVGGCAVLTGGNPLTEGLAYGVKIAGLETLNSVAAWSIEHAAGLQFDQALHPAVAAHLARLHPAPSENPSDACGHAACDTTFE